MHRRAVLGRGRKQLSSRWWYLRWAWRAEGMQVVERQGGWKGKGSIPEAQQLAQ